jgi:uncharacterized membrane protein
MNVLARVSVSASIFLLLILLGAGLIVGNQGQTNAPSLVLRFLALPVVSLWLGIALIKNKDLMRWLQSHCQRIGASQVVVGASALYVLVMFGMKAAKSVSLNYELFDAGLYVNKLFRMSRASPSDMWALALVEGHFQPISALFAMAYGIGNSPLVPYGLETLVLASGAVPVFLLAQKIWGPGIGPVALALAYLISPLVQFNDILGFHPDHIVLPALLWAFYFAETERFGRSTLALLVLCLASEPWIPLAAAFGVFLLFQHKKYILGSVTFAGFAAFFFFVLFVVLPKYGALNAGHELLTNSSPYATVLTGDPLQIASVLASPRKLFFVFFLFFPFLFLPLRAWPVLVVALPDLAKTLLSSEMLHFSVEGHYTLGLVAVMFVGYIYGLKEVASRLGECILEKLPILTLVLTLGLSVAHSPLPTSFNFWSNWSGGAFNYQNYLSDGRTQSLCQVERLVGDDVNSKVEVTNGAFTPELGKRKSMVHLFPGPNWKDADYIVIDKTKFKGAGGESGQASYAARLATAESQLPEVGFTVLYDDAYVKLWARSQQKLPTQ